MNIPKRRGIFLITVVGWLFLISGTLNSAIFGQETCEADSDINDDGTVLSVADMTYLLHYLFDQGPAPPVPYKADLNGDCAVDQLDLELYQSYFADGLGVFDPYGGYPPPTCCEPDMTIGGCCVDNQCRILNPANCLAEQGEYYGDGSGCYQNPGDANDDGMINVGDAVYLINYFFKGGSAPPTPANGDPNGDCLVDMEDLVFLVCSLREKQIIPVDCTCQDPVMGESRNCLPGDANYDLVVNVADAVYMINYVFGGGPGPEPYSVLSGDANGDRQANVGDAVYIINYVFSGGPLPESCGGWLVFNQCFHPDGYWID